jgi:hypothetical protein
MLVQVIRTEGHGLDAVINIGGHQLHACDWVSPPDAPFVPGSAVEAAFDWLGTDDATWEDIFRANPEHKAKLESLGGWRYRAYGKIVSVDPVRVDVGIMELDGPVESHDTSLVGEYIAWKIDRLDVNGMHPHVVATARPGTRSESKARESLLTRLRPKTWLGYWSAAAFLIAVIRLLLIQGIALSTLMLFLFPSFLAVAFQLSDRRSTRVVATLFLTLVDIGVAIGPIPWVFPGLHPVDARLSQADNRTLAWYVLMYLLYIFAVLPPFLFGRGLFSRKRKPGDFSTFTNVVGLVAWVLIGPLMVWFCVTKLGLWPPVE